MTRTVRRLCGYSSRAWPGAVRRLVRAPVAEERDDAGLARPCGYPSPGARPESPSKAEISASSCARVKWRAVAAPVGQAAAQVPQPRQWTASTNAFAAPAGDATAGTGKTDTQMPQPPQRASSTNAASGSTSRRSPGTSEAWTSPRGRGAVPD